MVQRVHKPVWKAQRLLDKTSWSGNLETMQYFATLNYFNPTSSSTATNLDDNRVDNDKIKKVDEEYWLPDEIIDVQIQSPKDSQSNLQNVKKASIKRHDFDFDELSNSSDLSMNNINENETISSSSSTNSNKINKNGVSILKTLFEKTLAHILPLDQLPSTYGNISNYL